MMFCIYRSWCWKLDWDGVLITFHIFGIFCTMWEEDKNSLSFQWLLHYPCAVQVGSRSDVRFVWALRRFFRIASLRSPGSITKNIPEKDPSTPGRMVSGWHKSGTVGDSWGVQMWAPGLMPGSLLVSFKLRTGCITSWILYFLLCKVKIRIVRPYGAVMMSLKFSGPSLDMP